MGTPTPMSFSTGARSSGGASAYFKVAFTDLEGFLPRRRRVELQGLDHAARERGGRIPVPAKNRRGR
jgi:hypothetical protein